jgi:hypothetical protein
MPITRPQALAQLKEAAERQLALAEEPVAGDPTSFTAAEFAAAAEKFVAAWQAHADQYMRTHFPRNPKVTIGVDKGPKYWRIWKADIGSDGKEISKSSVGFIDKTTGFLLKSDGWKRPAKGPRGDVFKDAPSKWQTPYSIS